MCTDEMILDKVSTLAAEISVFVTPLEDGNGSMPMMAIQIDCLRQELAVLLLYDGHLKMDATMIRTLCNEVLKTNGWHLKLPPKAPKEECPAHTCLRVQCGTLRTEVTCGNAADKPTVRFVGSDGHPTKPANLSLEQSLEWLKNLKAAVAEVDAISMEWAHKLSRQRVIYNAQLRLWRLHGHDNPPILSLAELLRTPVKVDSKRGLVQNMIEQVRCAWHEAIDMEELANFREVGRDSAEY